MYICIYTEPVIIEQKEVLERQMKKKAEMIMEILTVCTCLQSIHKLYVCTHCHFIFSYSGDQIKCNCIGHKGCVGTRVRVLNN